MAKTDWKIELKMASMNMKCFGENLLKYGQDLNAENDATLIREIIAKSLMILQAPLSPVFNPGCNNGLRL